MTQSTIDLQTIFPPIYQKALIDAAKSTNLEIRYYINTHETWRILPIEEKSNRIRSMLFNNILEFFKAEVPEKLEVAPIKSNKLSKFGTVNIIAIGNTGLHLISNRRDECPTLRRFRHWQIQQELLFDDTDMYDDMDSEFSQLQIFECVYRKKGNEIIELDIWDRYDTDCKELQLVIVEGLYAPHAENTEVEAPKITFKSSGKDAAQ